MERHYNFNSHARVGRDNLATEALAYRTDFNSHARVGRDFKTVSFVSTIPNFNSHARVGRDVKTGGIFLMFSEFQLTRPCRA